MDFTDVADQSNRDNRRLRINGLDHVLVTRMGAPGSQTGLDLQGIDAHLVRSYALAADLDAGDFGPFTPLGSRIRHFSGAFDGLGHQISNLQIVGNDTTAAGLFSHSSGDVRNVALKEASVTSQGMGQVIAGSLVGQLSERGSVTNVHTMATVDVHADEFAPKAIAGGIIGVINGGKLTNAYAHGTVRASTTAAATPPPDCSRVPVAGGAIGAATYSVAGGIAGHVHGEARISNAHTAAGVTGSATRTIGPAESFAGGAIGVFDQGVYHRLTAVGEVADKSAGNTAVSMHRLIGNHPHAVRGTKNELTQPPAAVSTAPSAGISADMPTPR